MLGNKAKKMVAKGGTTTLILRPKSPLYYLLIAHGFIEIEHHPFP